MSKLAILLLGAGLAVGLAQTPRHRDARPTTPTTGPNTTGTPGMGANVPVPPPPHGSGEANRAEHRDPGDHETGTPAAGTATSGPVTLPARSAAPAHHSRAKRSHSRRHVVRTQSRPSSTTPRQ